MFKKTTCLTVLISVFFSFAVFSEPFNVETSIVNSSIFSGSLLTFTPSSIVIERQEDTSPVPFSFQEASSLSLIENSDEFATLTAADGTDPFTGGLAVIGLITLIVLLAAAAR